MIWKIFVNLLFTGMSFFLDRFLAVPFAVVQHTCMSIEHIYIHTCTSVYIMNLVDKIYISIFLLLFHPLLYKIKCTLQYHDCIHILIL